MLKLLVLFYWRFLFFIIRAGNEDRKRLQLLSEVGWGLLWSVRVEWEVERRGWHLFFVFSFRSRLDLLFTFTTVVLNIHQREIRAVDIRGRFSTRLLFRTQMRGISLCSIGISVRVRRWIDKLKDEVIQGLLPHPGLLNRVPAFPGSILCSCTFYIPGLGMNK